MMTSSNENMFRVAGLLWGQQRGTCFVTRSFHIFYLRPNKRLTIQSIRRWFETQSRPLMNRLNMIRCHIHDNHNPAVMVIADDLVRIWCHDICTHHNGTYQYRKIMHTLSLDTYVILWKYIIIFFFYGIRCKSILIRMLGFYLSGPSHDCICPLQWRHYGRDLVSNHRRLDCLLNRLLRRRWQKTLKLHVTALCGGNSPVTAEFSSQRTSNAENVSIWWHHHAIGIGIFPGHILICFDCMSRMHAHPPSMCNQSGHAIVPRLNYATWFGHGQKGCSGNKWWNVSFLQVSIF